MSILKKGSALFSFIVYSQMIFGQTILVEGKGVDSITLGIKESKVIQMLGTEFRRKRIKDAGYLLNYPEKNMALTFDKDSVVVEISLGLSKGFTTTKGLKIRRRLTISDVENIYGDDWWTSEGNAELGYDIGIRFTTNKRHVKKIIIEESDLEQGNDYSFYEYLEGNYIPLNLEECYSELDKILDDEIREAIKNKTENQFTADAHFGIGLFIRNSWGLWKGSRLYHYFKSMGISHPDDMSGIILTSYHRRLNKKGVDLKNQIFYYQEYWKKYKRVNP